MYKKHFEGNKYLLIIVFIFIILLGLRLFFIINHGDGNQNALIWGSIYQIVAWFGAICGLYFSKLWGGYKSLIGRTNLFFALGLLAQSFGQTVYSFYFFKGGEILYPSIGDIGFLGSVLFYILGVLTLAKASDVKICFGSYVKKVQSLLIPVVLLAISYWIFLKDYLVDWNSPIKTLLDFGYPLGQVFYVSIAILVLISSRNVLGGIMKKPVIFFLIALIIQYISDFTFLFQMNQGNYIAGGVVDFMYFTSYFLMALSLIQLSVSYNTIKDN